jgi:hypothetical protein
MPVRLADNFSDIHNLLWLDIFTVDVSDSKYFMGEFFEAEIRDLEASNRQLAVKRDRLLKEAQAQKRIDARYFYLHDQKECLEREIAALEGRPYNPEDEQKCFDPPD